MGVWVSSCGRKSMKRKVREANMWVWECVQLCVCVCVCVCVPVVGDP